MNEQETPAQESGIFQPKAINESMIPESGAKKARKIGIALAAVAVVVLCIMVSRSLWLHPIKKFYRSMNRHDAAAMTEAFPSWLVDADMSGESMSVEAMCQVVINNLGMIAGNDGTVHALYSGYTPIEAEKLEKIQAGIEQQFQIKTKVSDGRLCAMEVTYRNTDGKEQKQIEYVTMYRINGHWCILDVPNTTK
ncbi:MAG: hypothetical protein MJ071_05560 [Oscillospiraceae bacterium]|nr:hypothetical protein [Oscillospiraceae bacterium]